MGSQKEILEKIGGKIPRTCSVIHQSIAEDYGKMEARMSNIEDKVATIKKNMATKKDLEQLKHTLLPLRDKASKWELTQTLFRSKLFWILTSVFMCALTLAGQRMYELIKPAVGM